MDDEQRKSISDRIAALWRALRPAVPAVIGASALTFLFVAVMPMAWVASIGWQLYLDRLSDLFVPPVGNGGRLALAIGMTTIAALLAGLAALAFPGPRGAVTRLLQRRGSADDVLPRRRADAHPDDAPRPPIRAGRDLPEGGLGPLVPQTSETLPDPVETAVDAAAEEELILADLAPVDYAPDDGDAPWLQPAEIAGRVIPDAADTSLGAMVARFEAGLERRRAVVDGAADGAPPTLAASAEGPVEVDFALEAALSTLSRMTRRAVG